MKTERGDENKYIKQNPKYPCKNPGIEDEIQPAHRARLQLVPSMIWRLNPKYRT
jgi:hypothetical protein